MRAARGATVAHINSRPHPDRPADRFGARGVVIQFPGARPRLAPGIYELNNRENVTHFNPSCGEEAGVVGRNFFSDLGGQSVARYYLNFRAVFSGAEPSWESPDGTLTFVKVGDAVCALVEREGGGR